MPRQTRTSEQLISTNPSTSPACIGTSKPKQASTPTFRFQGCCGGQAIIRVDASLIWPLNLTCLKAPKTDRVRRCRSESQARNGGIREPEPWRGFAFYRAVLGQGMCVRVLHYSRDLRVNGNLQACLQISSCTCILSMVLTVMLLHCSHQ